MNLVRRYRCRDVGRKKTRMREAKGLWQALKNLVTQTLGFYETLHLAQKRPCLQDSDRITSARYAGIRQRRI
jgi:hypothetical protein